MSAASLISKQTVKLLSSESVCVWYYRYYIIHGKPTATEASLLLRFDIILRDYFMFHLIPI